MLPRRARVRSRCGLAAAHKKIDAIMLYRVISGLGLKESKDAVDKM